MSLFYRQKKKVFFMNQGKWVDGYETVDSPFTPLPTPFTPKFTLDHLAGNVNVTDDSIIDTVKNNVKLGKKDGTVYGVYDRTPFGDTRGDVPYSDIIMK